jgi:hypothetical protein
MDLLIQKDFSFLYCYIISLKIQIIMIIEIFGLAFSLFGNFISSSYGFKNTGSQDKDLLLPFSIFIFLFFPLLISLPEAHYKLVNYSFSK